jgi:surface protein
MSELLEKLYITLQNIEILRVSLRLQKSDMSKCKTIGCMFTNCTSLTTLDLSAWDTRSLTDMNQAFQNCTSLTKLNVSGWDVSKVTNMTLSFVEDRTLSSLDLSTWDNSAVTSMKDVFSMMDSLNEVSLGSKFKFVGTSPFLPDQTGHVAGADGKWYDTDGNGYAPADIPSNKAMTYYASKDLVPGITISGNAEVGETLTATVNNLSEEEITGYQWYTVDDSSNETAIANATAHTYTVTANEVGKKILCKAFYKNGSATKNVKTTPTDNVTPQKTAFAVYSADDNSLDFYKRTEVPTAGSTFKGKTATAVYTGIETYTYTRNLPWNGYASKIKTATVVDDGLQPKSTASWFTNCKSITQCDMSKLDTSTLASSQWMFYNCSSLTTIGDLSGWDVSNLANASHMFVNCSSLTTLNLSGWDVSNLASSQWMFYNCSSLTTIGDLSGWDVSNLANASHMFDGCSKLTTIGDLSGWDVSNLASSQWMFFNCSRLSVNCSSWDVSKVTNHSNFNTNAPGVILPLAWQTSSDEGDENSAIAPLCEEQGNGDALSVPSENDNNDADEAASKTDGKASADSETEGSNTASADDAGAKEEEASGNIVQEETAAA